MQFPDGMSEDRFLQDHWQRKSLEIPNGISPIEPSLEPEELAWLATLDDVESRLVFTERFDGGLRYRVETGPFEPDYLASLPDSDWTLLVHDVEKHLPDFRDWFASVPFVPDWRIDDLMISFAAPGGSVGPHRDNYDVFLCQALGEREWRITSEEIASDADASTDLSLLQCFDDPEPFTASRGDVLYLPPGIAHWGIAKNKCMTYSLGMRAPSREELRCAFDRLFPEDENPFVNDSGAMPTFYEDRSLAPSRDDQHRASLSASAVMRCRDIISPGTDVSPLALATTLGCVVSDVKAWLNPEPEAGDVDKLISQLVESESVRVHGMARIAYWASDEDDRVFVNGLWHSIPPGELPWVESLCSTRQTPGIRLLKPENPDFIRFLLDAGLFDLDSAGE